MTENRVTIKIPRHLYRQLGPIVAEVGFPSVNDLLVFVLRTLVIDAGMIKRNMHLKQILE